MPRMQTFYFMSRHADATATMMSAMPVLRMPDLRAIFTCTSRTHDGLGLPRAV